MKATVSSPTGKVSQLSAQHTETRSWLLIVCSIAMCVFVQHAREEEIAERKAMKRAERDIARKKEFVRRVRLQIEEKRAEVSSSCSSQARPPPFPPKAPASQTAWS